MRTLRIQGIAISFVYTVESEDGKTFEGVLGTQEIQATQIPEPLRQQVVGEIVKKLQKLYKEEFKIVTGWY